MDLAIGADIVDIDRFVEASNRWGDRFLRRLLTETEIAYCRKKVRGAAEASMAVRFAAKEALIKALSESEQNEFRWHDVEIRNCASGKPVVYLKGRLAELLVDRVVSISLSHSQKCAIAMVCIHRVAGDDCQMKPGDQACEP
ncbi:MAG TPA: holo-ACP synthase [bacterium]|jgi:holo-[acyl-carrier protein] synthase|nr:holo-ACP synthase [bacterium]HNT65974.1 holo-ACP synthase [bacterium]HOX85986.1 holo-ACP synthase [bacterium]HPG45031.1 holo-ACP synthase [bacterium]HPM97273.1 holo-ACP synthase [bacterium]